MQRPTGGNVFQPTVTIFEIFYRSEINVVARVLIRRNAHANITNVPTKFHEDWTTTYCEKNVPPPGGHSSDYLYDDWTINVAYRVLSRKNTPPPGGHVFQPTGTIFELIQDISRTNLLIKKKNTPPPGGHVFQPTGTILELIQDTSRTNLLIKFHKDWQLNVATRVFLMKNALPPDMVGTNLLTKFHDDRTINVASRVLTRKNTPPPGGHYEFIKNIIKTNLLTNTNLPTKFHEDRTINVASSVLTRQMLTPHDRRRTKGYHKSSKRARA
ncbi:hypothetical protein DPMN_155166 [Dreissena polymorpha]|uniref:Uncharacterized protein n=1 Tax=Dreissena polymorpha TaxID=45954 RepID=A0A9D4JAM9_DREPO|nr:hypothetical protein DPMN_155166 [Dreissena polymorpha]